MEQLMDPSVQIVELPETAVLSVLMRQRKRGLWMKAGYHVALLCLEPETGRIRESGFLDDWRFSDSWFWMVL